MEEAPSPAIFVVAIGAAVLMGLAVVRWGRRGAVGGYLLGLGVCLVAWGFAVYLSTRLSGAAPDPFGPALGRSLAAVVVLASLWLAVASCGVVAGALARLVLHRRRAARRRAAAPPAGAQPRRSRRAPRRNR